MFRATSIFHSVPKILRQLVWQKYYKYKGSAVCSCCQKNKITPLTYECSHIVAKSMGGRNVLNNLIPACHVCNNSMGIENLYVFRSRLLGKLCNDMQRKSQKQKDVIKFYKYLVENITIRVYSLYFREWIRIISQCMRVTVVIKGHKTIYRVKCKCGYKFVYIVNTNGHHYFPRLTCKNTRQNIIDVICDHLCCIIYNDKFVDGTLDSVCYKVWKKTH